MSKKTNTILFMIFATILNLVLMLALFIICIVLMSKFGNPESSAAPLWVMLCFIVSIGGSFALYTLIVKALNKKFHLDEKMEPLFRRRRK